MSENELKNELVLVYDKMKETDYRKTLEEEAQRIIRFLPDEQLLKIMEELRWHT